MKTVFYWRAWINIPKWGANIKLFKNVVFSHYSNKVLSGADQILKNKQRPDYYDGFWGWFRKNRDWRLCLTLDPIGNPDALFTVGYYSPDKSPQIIKVAPIIRRVGDGPFAMRVGLKDCFFFAIGNKKIQLEKKGQINRDSPKAKGGIYKNMKIY